MAVLSGRVLWQRGGRRRCSAALLALAGFAAVLLAGCGGSSEPGESAKTGGTLTIGLDRALGSLNPATDSGASSGGFFLYLPYATLVNRNADDGSFGPGLAESFGYVGEGNMKYQLKLRADLKFADGTPLDAEAVKTWLTYFPKGGGGYASLLDIASIETPDKLTVLINLKSPTPAVSDALANAWGMVISPKAVADPKQLTAGAPGAGPYVYDQAQTVTGTGASYTLVPNKNFHDQGEIKWSKVVIKVIEDGATRLRAAQSGQIDVAAGSVSTLKAAKSAGLAVTTAPAGWLAAEIIDSGGAKAKALGDVRVRQALNYAIDRDAIVKSLYAGAVESTSTPGTTDGFDAALRTAYAYDPAKAKQLLAEAGYPNGFTFTIVASNSVAAPVTQAVAQKWTDIGVKVKVVSTATNTEFFQKFLTESAFLIDYPATSTLTLTSARLRVGSPLNPYKVDDSEINQLFTRAQTAAQAEQPELMKQIIKRVTDQAYSVPLATNLYALYATDKVKGVAAKQFLNASPVATTWSAS